MTRETADELFPKFKQLEGTFSEHFSSEIEQVLVSYRSFAMIRWHKECLKNNYSWPTRVHHDEAEYTIVGVLKDGRIQSIRTLVKTEQIQELYSEAEVVDYMTA